MNKLLLFVLLYFISILTANAQLVEHYENPQRFQIPQFNDHSNTELIGGATTTEEYFRPNFFITHRFTREQRVVYGIAIPINTFDQRIGIPCSFGNVLFPYERWQKVLHYYDTSGCRAIICNTTQVQGYEYELASTAPIRFGEAALCGNYFKMPDEDSIWLMPFNSTFFPVVEVYFEQPVVVTDSFVIGINLQPYHFWNETHDTSFYPGIGPLLFRLNYDYGNLHLFNNINNINYFNIPDYTSVSDWSDLWGAPFPILAPAPCMPPIWMKVAEQHRMGATIEWRAQYANTTFEVEYGPQGFAEGTGTTVGPIGYNAQYKGHITLNNLAMDADYTVRIRSYCDNSGGYSDWTETDFHTGTFYVVSTATNNDEWGFVVGGGEYPADTTVRLFAYPRNEYHPFLNWSDGNNQNPRTVTITRDTSFTAIFDNTEGIEGAGQPFITICPNPASGTTTVACDATITEWTLYDIQGRTVATGTPAATTATIDLNALRPAIYILTVGTEKGTVTRKIVVKQ